MKRKTGAQKLRELVGAVPEGGWPMEEVMRRTGLAAKSIETYMYTHKLPLRLEAGVVYRITAEDLPTPTAEGPSGPCAESHPVSGAGCWWESNHLAVSQPPPGWQWTGTAWARTGDQPAPSGGTGDVWGEIIALLPEGSRARALAVERRQVGIDRYGVPLGRGDGRDELRDEREELLDAAGYRQRRLGRPGKLAQGVAELLATAVDPDAWWEAYYEWSTLADAERIRELAARGTWTDREANAWRAVMRVVDPTVGAVIAALSGVTP